MNIDYKVGEVKLSYKPKFKNQQKVTCSEDAYRYIHIPEHTRSLSGSLLGYKTIP